MRFEPPLTPARLLRRYKRFLADIVFEDGTEATVHVPNPGAMLGVSDPGARVWLSRAKPGRKLDWTLVAVETAAGWAGVDTTLPNRLVREALELGAIAELAGYASLRAEVRFGAASRVDFLLEAPGRPACWLEVKNCHMARSPGLAEFPDCTAARSARHMGELAARVGAGERAAALVVVQRTDCAAFAPAADIDPAFAAAYRAAGQAGVELLAYACVMGPDEIRLDRAIPVQLR
jgi:sugar fermentation stimulation protein A